MVNWKMKVGKVTVKRGVPPSSAVSGSSSSSAITVCPTEDISFLPSIWDFDAVATLQTVAKVKMSPRSTYKKLVTQLEPSALHSGSGYDSRADHPKKVMYPMAIENTQVVALYLKGAYSSGKHMFIHGIIKYRMLSTSMKIDNP